MNKTTTLIIGILISLIIGYGIYDFYQTHEYKEKTIHTGFKGEARTNPFYASRLFLKRMGIPTETINSIQGLGELPDINTVLLISTQRTTLSPERTEKLVDWVRSGGHLIAQATRNWKYNGKADDEDIEDSDVSPDPLQRFMGVHTGSRTAFDEILSESQSELIDELLDSTITSKKTDSIKLNNADKKLHIKLFRFPRILVDDDVKERTEEIKIGADNFIVRQKVGRGMITLVSDFQFIRNKKIEAADHAEILWYLTHGLQTPINQPARIWLVHNDKMPSLLSLLWKNAWAFILSLLLLFLAWLMMSTRRFGPMIPKPEENRRSLKEHITSSGNFYWKNNKQHKLIESSRQALLQRLAQVHPGWAQRSQEEQIHLLVEQLSMTPEAVQRLLFANDVENANEFTQLIRQLEKIRRDL